jgi:hypothetical protein
MTQAHVQPITREHVDAALLLLEHQDIAAANCVRAYIQRLEGALRQYNLGADGQEYLEPGEWVYSLEQGERNDIKK